MTFRIDLTTRDAQQLRFDCAPDQDLLTAAATANIVLPSQCRKGSCGACHAVVTHGDFRMGNHSADALSRDQAGAMLMCRTTPCSDLQVSLPYDHTKVLRQPVPRRTTTIVSLDTIARHTVRLVLEISPTRRAAGRPSSKPGNSWNWRFRAPTNVVLIPSRTRAIGRDGSNS